MGDFFQGAVDSFFGDGRDPGLFGTTQRQVEGYNFDPKLANIYGFQNFQDQLANRGSVADLRRGAQINTGPQDQVRGQQSQLSQMLMDQAMGRGPSIAQAQLQQATDRNMSQALALGASQASGMRGAGALRGIQNQQAQIGQQMAADSGLLRLQEQMQARGMLGQQLGNMRGQDIGLATSQAGLQQNQHALNDSAVQFYLSQGMNLAQAQMAARMNMQGQQASQQTELEKLRMQAANQAQANRMGLVNAALDAGKMAAGVP